jgi:hypothetical protein
MRETRIMFSHLLPVVDLALLVVLVFVPISLMSVRLYEASAGSNQVNIHSGQFDVTLPRNQIVPLAIRMVTVSKAQIIMAINLPSVLIPLISGWHPPSMLLETWQALVFPFFCLPFWWLVGRGLDGLLRGQRLHWSILLAGTLLFGLFVFDAFSLYVIPVANRSNVVWVTKGFAGWTIAFAVLPIAWIAQSIRQRRNPAASPDATL